MAAKTALTPGSGRALVPSDRARAAIVKRLNAYTGTITTAIVRQIADTYPWYAELGAEERSWISMIVAAGVANYAAWFDDDTNLAVDPTSIFSVAPQSMTRQLSLQQTVDLLRTSISVIDAQIDTCLPKADRAPLHTALLYYSRQVAFAAAEVYARAAESRGSWDGHIEARVVDALVREDVDDAVLSQASTLGWPAGAPLAVIVGDVTGRGSVETLHQGAERLGRLALGAVQGGHLIAVISRTETEDDAVRTAGQLRDCFGPGPVIVGGVAANLAGAHKSALQAISGAAAVNGWRERPDVVAASALLPERALAGNEEAKQALVADVYQPLMAAGADLLETCVGFLDHSGSIEATARDLYIHPNTVRYRLKRIQDVTGYSPTAARDAYILRVAITLGRLTT